MAKRPGRLLVLVLVLAGCASSRHFPEESRDAEQAIDRAEDAGADEHSRIMLAQARDTLDSARRAEDDAIKDKHAARDQLHAARARLERAQQRLDIRARQKEEAGDERKAQLGAKDRIRDRQEELRRKGVAEGEIAKLTDTDATLATVRLRSIDATLASFDKEIELLELEKKDAQLDIDAANARLATADQRLQVARLLFQRAQEQAKVAEAESLDAQRLGLRARETEM